MEKKLDVEKIVHEVLLRIADTSNHLLDNNIKTQEKGIFSSMDDAIEQAYIAQKKLIKLSMETREEIIKKMREVILDHINEIAKLAVEETGLGKVEDKINKNILAAKKTPGIEDIISQTYTGDNGFTLVEHAPYGVIGAITPSTNPSETVICNSIGMIAAGNSVVFNSHPNAKRVTNMTIRLLNDAIIKAGGPPNLIVAVDSPTIQTSQQLMMHPKIRLLVVTGGPQIVNIAMKSGKKVIAAGPGNPPVVVDETADMGIAAQAIVDGASFDNNILCIAEKVVFVVSSVADDLINEMKARNCIELNTHQMNELMKHIGVKDEKGQWHPNKAYVGKDIKVILKDIGIHIDSNIKLAVAIVEENHPLVYMEQLMPVLPIVRVKDIDDAIDKAYLAEQGNYHTALIHSKNIDNLSKMAIKMNTSIFVKNAPSYAGLGMLGEGFTTYTIASPTGEGLTSPISFTRQRRCVLKDNFRII